jgi:hypothetical protein
MRCFARAVKNPRFCTWALPRVIERDIFRARYWLDLRRVPKA